MKRFRLLLIIFTLLLMAGCSNEKQTNPIEPVNEDALTKLLKDVPDDVQSEFLKDTPVEIRAELSKVITRNMSDELNSNRFFVAFVNGTSPQPNPAGRCAPLLTVDPITGNGIGTTIHRFTTLQSHCINPDSLEFTDGVAVFTSAGNGDQLMSTYFGDFIATINPNILIVNGRTTFTGGTGVFEGATGNGSVFGLFNINSGKLALINISTLNTD